MAHNSDSTPTTCPSTPHMRSCLVNSAGLQTDVQAACTTTALVMKVKSRRSKGTSIHAAFGQGNHRSKFACIPFSAEAAMCASLLLLLRNGNSGTKRSIDSMLGVFYSPSPHSLLVGLAKRHCVLLAPWPQVVRMGDSLRLEQPRG